VPKLAKHLEIVFNLYQAKRKHVLMNIEHVLMEQHGRPCRGKIIEIAAKM